MNPFFDFDLPEHLIAQQPAEERDGSRLLCLNRLDGALAHHHFRDLPELLNPGDLLVLNDTRVIPARVIGRREQTGGKWEGLFLQENADHVWEMLGQTKGHPQPGEIFVVEPGGLRLIYRGRAERHWLMQPEVDEPASELLARYGQIPLPPYIRKGRAGATDRERYQTVYARHEGSVAAPTAGLHFTPRIFENLKSRGIATTSVTLHVGLGTFEPMRTDDPALHVMHGEQVEVTEAAVEAIGQCRVRGGRVIGVGTTATRALESGASSGELRPWQGVTDLFIHPPYSFKAIDGMITNFHLPRTTLLLLVGALAGMDRLKHAYELAIANKYRFYSYGDAMLIV